MNKRIKRPEIQGGSKIKAPQLIQITQLDYPVFCFKHIHRDHGFDGCDMDEKAALLDKLFQWSQMTWHQIQFAPRHGLGSEKILRTSIKPTLPPFLTDDVDHLLALRFQGKKPILIHRNRFIMHVIFVDNKFGVYDH